MLFFQRLTLPIIFHDFFFLHSFFPRKSVNITQGSRSHFNVRTKGVALISKRQSLSIFCRLDNTTIDLRGCSVMTPWGQRTTIILIRKHFFASEKTPRYWDSNNVMLPSKNFHTLIVYRDFLLATVIKIGKWHEERCSGANTNEH